MKYTAEVKEKAVEAFKSGMSFKEIQMTIGPNPKAVGRYLVAAGIDQKAVRAELKAAGKLKPEVNTQGKGKKVKAQAEVQTEEIIEE